MSHFCQKHHAIYDDWCPTCVLEERDQLKAEIERLRAEMKRLCNVLAIVLEEGDKIHLRTDIPDERAIHIGLKCGTLRDIAALVGG